MSNIANEVLVRLGLALINKEPANPIYTEAHPVNRKIHTKPKLVPENIRHVYLLIEDLYVQLNSMDMESSEHSLLLSITNLIRDIFYSSLAHALNMDLEKIIMRDNWQVVRRKGKAKVQLEEDDVLKTYVHQGEKAILWIRESLVAIAEMLPEENKGSGRTVH